MLDQDELNLWMIWSFKTTESKSCDAPYVKSDISTLKVAEISLLRLDKRDKK